MFTHLPPLSLYIHIPWCIKKCPYCDFNSHELKQSLPEDHYVETLLAEFSENVALIQERPLTSIFFGGGTPSLFSPHSIKRILMGIQTMTTFHPNIEITLEANPGTIDQQYFADFRPAGINRLSLGIQSLQDDKLKALGRIHDRHTAMQGIAVAQAAGFHNMNLDLMFGLPQQSLRDALADLETALSFHPTHLSWYQLTLEPNTLFYRYPPPLPADDAIWEMQLAGQALLEKAGFTQYEVSAYSQPQQLCLHNQNYWEFGDYLGIGAGAYSKITLLEKNQVVRFSQLKNPRDYLDGNKRHRSHHSQPLAAEDLILEFMLNGLRLTNGIAASLFTERTGLSRSILDPLLDKAIRRGLLKEDTAIICPTELGKRFLNDLVGLFLP
jgi:putative oxygen-independent coproporphyrinogen III oxidase